MEHGIKQIFISCGADVCGIADADRFSAAPKGFNPTDIYTGCKSVIAFGIALPRGLAQVDPRFVYGHYNDFACGMVDRAAMNAAKQLERLYGATAVPLPCDAPYEYWDEKTLTGKGLVSMKHAAVLCGLGTLGKNSLLINAEYGNSLILGAVLTDLQLRPDELCEPLCIDGCRRCEESCPVGAIENGRVAQRLCRTNSYGKTPRGFDVVNCNKCRTVCPMRYGKT